MPQTRLWKAITYSCRLALRSHLDLATRRSCVYLLWWERCLRKILRIWVDFQSQLFVLGYLNNSHQATQKMSKLPMPFLQANSEISSFFAARPDRYANHLMILRLRLATVKSAFRFCHLQSFSGSRQTR